MELLYEKEYEVTDLVADRFGFLKPSGMLFFIQDVAGKHAESIVTPEELAQKNLFWAIIRHRLQVQRLPKRGEKIRLETWPMPTTRVAYPRCVVAYDARGQILFSSIALWVLMDRTSRAMVLPSRSGVTVEGLLRGNELPSPSALPAAQLPAQTQRRVCFTDLDVNGHMNNCRYMDWAQDLLPSSFFENRRLQDVTLCYLAEAREGDNLALAWDAAGDDLVRLEILRCSEEKKERVFSAELRYAT